jgi:site-specific DNA-cytosine methylase
MKKNIKILVGCEYSGRVRDAFENYANKIGVDDEVSVWSCDLCPTESEQTKSAGKHIQKDIIDFLKFWSPEFDLLIAHPPCTELTIRGAYHTYRRKSYLSRLKAMEFFINLAECSIDHIAIENPVGIMSSAYRKPDQIIQPYWFGDKEQKRTCLWLKNLPKLNATEVVEPEFYFTNTRNKKSFVDKLANLPRNERAKARSKTFKGIASAMAEQWINYLIKL